MTVQTLIRHGVGNEDRNTTYRLKDKVDNAGKYLEFPNVTVLHPIVNSTELELSALPGRLLEAAGEYLSPLPATSYHATLICGPLHIEMNSPIDKVRKNLFQMCLQEPCWEIMANNLAERSYFPEHLAVGDIICKGSGGVTVYLKNSTVEDSDDEAKELAKQIREELREIGKCQAEGILRRELQKVREREDLGKKATKNITRLLTCLMEPHDRPWHITIAYPRKEGGPMPEEVQEKVRDIIRDAFQVGITDDSSNSSALPFGPAQFCSKDTTSLLHSCLGTGDVQLLHMD